MKKITKFLKVFLCAALLVTMIPTEAFAADASATTQTQATPVVKLSVSSAKQRLLL